MAMGYLSNIFEQTLKTTYVVLNFIVSNPVKNQNSSNVLLEDISTECNADNLESIVINDIMDKNLVNYNDLDKNVEVSTLNNIEVEDCHEIINQHDNEQQPSNEVLAEVIPLRRFPGIRVPIPETIPDNVANTLIDIYEFVQHLRGLPPFGTLPIAAIQHNHFMRGDPRQLNRDDPDYHYEDNSGWLMSRYVTCCLYTSMVFGIILFLLGVGYVMYYLFGNQVNH